jgi:tRNA(Ile)-lysidine synthase
MNLINQFKAFISENNLFSPKDKLLLAVSGGVDSVVLCELCKQAGFDFSIAHCNFQLRGEESERDEKFVGQLAEKYGVEILVKKFDTEKYAAENKLSIQEAARALRYEWLAEIASRREPGVHSSESPLPVHHLRPAYRKGKLTTPILTAHHADDNAETVLMNFCRGTGLHGLTGIAFSYGNVARPLLSFSKDELIEFASENKLGFVEDSSNLTSKYTRNFFRNEIIPAISKVYPQVKENLTDNIRRFKEIEKLYQLAVGNIKKKLMKQKGSEWHIPINQLMGYNNRALIYEIISDYGFSEKQIDEIIKLAESDSGRYIDSPLLNYRIIKHRRWFIISPVHSALSAIIVIEKSDKTILFEKGILKIDWLNHPPSAIKKEAGYFDAKEIEFPLILRKWKPGDYFYPLGMKKKKKLSRFFIDQKLSKTEKEKLWVLESNKKIIWVIGIRIDERFKITEKTKSVLKIESETA